MICRRIVLATTIGARAFLARVTMRVELSLLDLVKYESGLRSIVASPARECCSEGDL
jgi:hypothetical protein